METFYAVGCGLVKDKTMTGRTILRSEGVPDRRSLLDRRSFSVGGGEVGYPPIRSGLFSIWLHPGIKPVPTFFVARGFIPRFDQPCFSIWLNPGVTVVAQ